MTCEAAAPLLGLRPWTVRKKARLGTISASKIHGDWDITKEDIERYLTAVRLMGANRKRSRRAMSNV